MLSFVASHYSPLLQRQHSKSDKAKEGPKHQKSACSPQILATFFMTFPCPYNLQSGSCTAIVRHRPPVLGCRGSKVVGVENFGVFVEFLPGRQGLLHTSELATGETLATFKEGDIVDVFLAGVPPPHPLHPIYSQSPLNTEILS